MSNAQLTAEASIAFQAFQAMRESKRTYFTFLQDIDVKYKSAGAASSAETEQLAALLAKHDKNVTAFNTAMAAVVDMDARNTLIKLIS